MVGNRIFDNDMFRYLYMSYHMNVYHLVAGYTHAGLALSIGLQIILMDCSASSVVR